MQICLNVNNVPQLRPATKMYVVLMQCAFDLHEGLKVFDIPIS